LSTTDKLPSVGGPYVTRDVCEAVHGDQRDANARTWEEIRTLRRLVIGLVVGGQLFSGGLNVAGVAYWLGQHAAQPHPSTVQMVATARAEAREDVRELRREVRELAAAPAPEKTTQPAASASGSNPSRHGPGEP
jgi:hypothetical protein